MSPTTWLALLGAIGFEVMGTTLLQQSQQFTKPLPTAGLSNDVIDATMPRTS